NADVPDPRTLRRDPDPRARRGGGPRGRGALPAGRGDPRDRGVSVAPRATSGRPGHRLGRPCRPSGARERPPPRRTHPVPARVARPSARALVREPARCAGGGSVPGHALLRLRDAGIRDHDGPAHPRLARGAGYPGARDRRPDPPSLRGRGDARLVLVHAPGPEPARVRGRSGGRAAANARPPAGGGAPSPSMLRDQNRLAYEADQEFVRRLPPDLAPGVDAFLAGQVIPVADQLDLFRSLWDAHGRNAGERTRIQLAPANLHWCSDAALTALADSSARHGVGMHMHLLETAYQREYARRRTGSTAAQHLDRLGLLGPRLTLGHGVWLSAADIE